MAFNLAAILGGVVPAVLAASLQARFGSPAVGLLLAGLGLLGTCSALALPETVQRREALPTIPEVSPSFVEADEGDEPFELSRPLDPEPINSEPFPLLRAVPPSNPDRSG